MRRSKLEQAIDLLDYLNKYPQRKVARTRLLYASGMNATQAEVLDKLIEKGFIILTKRQPHATAKYVELSEEGRKKIREYKQFMLELGVGSGYWWEIAVGKE